MQALSHVYGYKLWSTITIKRWQLSEESLKWVLVLTSGATICTRMNGSQWDMLLCFHETATEHDLFAIQVIKAGATVKIPKSCDQQIFTNNNTNEMAIRNLHTNLYMAFHNVYFWLVGLKYHEIHAILFYHNQCHTYLVKIIPAEF